MARRKSTPAEPRSPEWKNAEGHLRWLSEFEQLVTRLAPGILGCETGHIGDGIQHALADLGRFVGADHAYVSQFNEDRTAITCTHEWRAPTLPSAIHLNKPVPADLFPWYVGRLKRGEVVLIPTLACIPAEASAERAAFTAMGVRSMIVVPLISKGQVIGAAGFDAVLHEQDWPEGVVHLLATVGEMFASAIEREKADVQIDCYEGRLRGLAFDLSLAEEHERHRIAEELHDDLIQMLILAKLKLGHLRLTLGAQPPGDEVAEVHGLLERSILSVRSLIAQLCPPALRDERGFVEAVRELVGEIRGRYGIEIQLVDDGRPKPLGERRRVTLYRCLRELLINVAKHAKARATTVRIVEGDSRLEVSVEDDGVGFDPSLVSSRSGAKGFGLLSVRERLHSFGGRLDVHSAPGKGATVKMAVLLNSGLNAPDGVV